MDMRFWKRLIAVAMMLAAFYAPVYAQVPAEVSSLSLGGTFSQAGGDLNIGFLGGVPLDFMNGHVTWFAQRDTTDDMVLTETLEAHVEGGPSWKGWELLAFGDVLRDLDRGLQEVKIGYAIEIPELSFGAWQGTAGAGNAARSREAVAAATGLEGVDLEAAVVSGGASVHWYGYLNLHHPEWDVDISLKALPKIDFSDAEFTTTLATRFDLGKGFSFDVAYKGIYETERRKFFGSLLGAVTWEM